MARSLDACEDFLYGFKAARRAARAAATAPRPSLPLALPLRPAPAPVGWRERRRPLGRGQSGKFQGRDGFDKGTLAAAPIGLMRAGQKPARSRVQRTSRRPLSNPPLRQREALTFKRQITVRFRTVTAADDALAQLDALLREYNKVIDTQGFGGLSPEGIMAMISRFQAAITRLTSPTSTYAWDMERQRTNASGPRLRALAGIVAALHDDIQAGWLASVIELAHADTYGDYLEMAEGLNAQRYKDAAAVIAGTSLEVHLKSLAAKHAISLQASNGSLKKTDTLNADLKKAGIYNALEQKQITAWLAIRNYAAHGHYNEYSDADVKALIDSVRNFIAKYAA